MFYRTLPKMGYGSTKYDKHHGADTRIDNLWKGTKNEGQIFFLV